MSPIQQTKKFRLHRLELIGVAVIVLGPALIAWFVYYNPGWMPLSHNNYGTIINPVRPVPAIVFQQLKKDEKLELESLRGRWVMVSIAGSDCSANCKDNFYKIRQMRRALGRDRGRVERLVVLLDGQSMDRFEKLSVEYPGVKIATGPQQAVKHFVDLIAPAGKTVEDHVYIIDPLGNLMMHYQPGADGVKMLKDLERLLKVSQIG